MSRQPRQREQPSLSEINATLFTCSLCGVLAYVCYPDQGGFHAMFIPVAMAFAAVGGTWHSLGLIWRDVKLRRKLKEREKTSDKYGSAREATWQEIVARGMSDPRSGRFLGMTKSSFPVFAPSDAPFTMSERPPGAGKTSTEVVGEIIHSAARGDSISVADMKGELSSICIPALSEIGVQSLLIDPAKTKGDEFPRVEFNPHQPVLDCLFCDDDNRRDAITCARDIAELLLPDDKGEAKHGYFRAGSKRLLAFATLYLCFTNPSKSAPSDSFELLNDAGKLRSVLKFVRDHLTSPHENDSVLAFLKSEAASVLSLWQDNPENLSSFLQWATQALGPFNQGGRLAGYGRDAMFDFSELRNSQLAVFVVCPPTHLREFEALVSLFHYCVFNIAKRVPTGRIIRAICDEMLNYKVSPNLAADLELMRGLNLRASFYIQSFNGLINKVGKDNANAIADYCDIKIYAGINSSNRSKAISDMLSDTTVRSEDYSHHHDDLDLSFSSKEHARKFVTPDEITSTEKASAWVFVQGLRPMKLSMLHYGEVEPWASLVGQNPLEKSRLTGETKLTLEYGHTGEISVRGVDYRKATIGEEAAWSKIVFAAGRYFIWLPAFAAVMAFSAAAGTPHVLFQYQYVGSGAAKFYTRCTYAGLRSQTVSSVDGRCPAVRFLTHKH